MNILVSVDNHYLDKAETMLFSLSLCVKESLHVYLINHSLQGDEVEAFEKYISKNCNAILHEIVLRNTDFDDFPIVKSYYSIEMFYRILAQFILPDSLDRILWLDADLIVMKNISEFYLQSFDGADFVVCPDSNYGTKWIAEHERKLGLPENHVYFNSGVMLMNLNLLRKGKTTEEIFHLVSSLKDKLKYPDQDILNYIYSCKVKYCDWKEYNYQMQGKTAIPPADLEHIAILHYTGDKKPWNYWDINSASKYWWRVRAQQGHKCERAVAYINKIKEMTVLYFRELRSIL